MTKLVILKLDQGNFQEGFKVTAQIGNECQTSFTTISGEWSSYPVLPEKYQNWASDYSSLDIRRRARGSARAINSEELLVQCQHSAREFVNSFQNWLNSQPCQQFTEKLCQALDDKREEIRIIFQTDDELMAKLPWHQWNLLADTYRRAEVALCPTLCEEPHIILPNQIATVRILAILGHSEGIDIEHDRQLLEQLASKGAEIKFLVEPKRSEISDSLWEQNWDILFFAGHSQNGQILLNQTESLTVEQLKFGLRRAIEYGLKLAILNGCDGLNLAKDLIDLNLTQAIIMREPVPDQVAQVFLKYFLAAFSQDDSLYLAVRRARERLSESDFEQKYPGSSGLPVIYQHPSMKPVSWHQLHTVKQHDWGEAPAVPVFFGRIEELATLEKWIVYDRCQLIAILGLKGIGKTNLSVKLTNAGIGKTDLSVKLLHCVQENFDYIIWRKLMDAPSITKILGDIIKFLSNQQEINLRSEIADQIQQLLPYLKKHRCLLIFDNVEDVLRSGERAGEYKEGHEGYGLLFKAIGETAHQSCLLLTSREKPQEITRLEGNTKPVRSWPLNGLDDKEGRKIFMATSDSFVASDEEWKTLIDIYKGNPLALELVAKHIDEVFFGDISQFLEKNTPIFNNDLKELLDWHFDRLSYAEREVMYWLAINREFVSLIELKEDLLSPSSKEQIGRTLQTLGQRIPLEKSAKQGFTLQPVLIEYMTNKLIKEVVAEIKNGNISLFNRHALIKALAKDYVRESQIRLILNGVWKELNTSLGPQGLENQFKQILSTLRQNSPKLPGYTAGNILNLLCQHYDTIEDYDFSHLAIWQAYLQGTNLHHLNFAYAEFDRLIFTQTFGNTLCLSFSPDGKLLATGDVFFQVHLWQVETSQQARTFQHIRTLKGHTNWIWSLAFSPDSQLIASTDVESHIKIWKIKDGSCLKALQDGYAVWSVAFSPDGQMIATGNDQGIIVLWDVNNGQCLKTLHGHDLAVWCVEFSPSGRWLASSSSDKTIRIWNYHTPECLAILSEHEDFIRSVTFSPDEKRLASGCDDMTVKLWELETFQCIDTLKIHENIVRSVSFHPDGDKLASAGDDGTVRLWNLKRGKCQDTLQQNSMISAVAFHPHTKDIATGGEDQSVRLWDSYEGKCLSTWQGYTTFAKSVSFSADGQTLACAYDDQVIRLWDVRTGVFRTLKGHTHIVWSVVFSPNGKFLASGSSDKTVKIWDLETNSCIKTLPAGRNNWIFAVAFSPDSQLIAAVGSDYTVKIWDFQTEKLLKTLKGHRSLITAVAFSPISPKGDILASASIDETIRIWNTVNEECLKVLPFPEDARLVDFNNNGQILAGSGGKYTIKLWDISDNYRCLKTLHGKRVAFSPIDQFMVSITENATLEILNIHSGECIMTLRGKTMNWMGGDIFYFVVFAPDGRSIATVSEDGSIKLWSIGDVLINNLRNDGKSSLLKKLRVSFWVLRQLFSSGQSLITHSKTMKIPKPYEGMDITGVTGLNDVQKISLKDLGAMEDRKDGQRRAPPKR